MNTPSSDNESAGLMNVSELATWNRERSSEELQSFITARFNRLPDTVDVE